MSDTPTETLHYHHGMSVEGAIERLEQLLASPPLKLSVVGGGLPQEMTMSPEEVVVTDRGHIRDLLWVLKHRVQPKEWP